jgi:hypothetical protein
LIGGLPASMTIQTLKLTITGHDPLIGKTEGAIELHDRFAEVCFSADNRGTRFWSVIFHRGHWLGEPSVRNSHLGVVEASC